MDASSSSHTTSKWDGDGVWTSANQAKGVSWTLSGFPSDAEVTSVKAEWNVDANWAEDVKVYSRSEGGWRSSDYDVDKTGDDWWDGYDETSEQIYTWSVSGSFSQRKMNQKWKFFGYDYVDDGGGHYDKGRVDWAQLTLYYTYTPPKPDLEVTSMKIDGSTASDQHFDPGESVRLDFQGHNDGDATSKTSIRMKWWYGTSAYSKTHEIDYGYLGTINGLSPDEYEWETDASWSVPTTPGTYWLTTKIDDNNQQTDEEDEGNNERTLRFIVDVPPKPDLRVKSLTASKTTVIPGDDIEIDAIVKNYDLGDAPKSQIGYWWGSAPGSREIFIGEGDIPNIGVLSYNEESADSPTNAAQGEPNFIIPDVAPGTYYLTAAADYKGNKADESNEGNNETYLPITVESSVSTIDGISRWWAYASEQFSVDVDITAGPSGQYSLDIDIEGLFNDFDLTATAYLTVDSSPSQYAFNALGVATIPSLSSGEHTLHINSFEAPDHYVVEGVTFQLDGPGSSDDELNTMFVSDLPGLTSLAGMSFEDGFGSSISVGSIQDLVEAFSPTIYLEVDEHYKPVSVESIWGSGTINALGQNPNADVPLDLPGTSPAEYFSTYYPEPADTTVYVSLVPDLDNDQLALNYWFYYPYSNWGEQGGLNNHESDWEGYVVYLDEVSPDTYAPTSIAAAQHHSGKWAAWTPAVTGGTTHPYLYVGLGGHATYLLSGVTYPDVVHPESHLGSGGAQPIDSVVYVDRTSEVAGETTSWALFSGRWGQMDLEGWVGIEGDDGPQGPVFQGGGQRWFDPWEWSADFTETELTIGQDMEGTYRQVIDRGIEWYVSEFGGKPVIGVGLGVGGDDLIDLATVVAAPPSAGLSLLLSLLKTSPVNFSITSYFDLADILGSTADGVDDWVTVWLEGGFTALSLGFEIPGASNVSFGIVPFEVDSLEDDPWQGVSGSLIEGQFGGAARLYGPKFDYTTDAGWDGDWWGKGTGLFNLSTSVDLINITWNFATFEIQESALRAAILPVGDSLVEDLLFGPLNSIAPGSVDEPITSASFVDIMLAATTGDFSESFIRPATSGVDDHGDEPGVATPITLDSTVPGIIKPVSIVSDIDVFSFMATSNGQYQFAVNTPASSLDPIVAIEDAGGILLEEDDDGGPGLDSLGIAYLSAGETYYIEVRGYNGTEVGEYELTITAIPGDAPVAVIDDISPSPAQPPTQTISFLGTGFDDGMIVAWEWTSDLDGLLSTSEDFSKSSNDLTVGSHQISFRVKDDESIWSEYATEQLVVNNALPTAEMFGVPDLPVKAGSTINLTLDGHDNDESQQSIVAGELILDGDPIGNPLPGNYQLTAPLESGLHTVTYRVQDDEGTWSDPIVGHFHVDAIPPIIEYIQTNSGDAQRSMVTSIVARFSEDVFDSLAKEDLILHNITTGENVAATDMAMAYNSGTNTATWTFPGLTGNSLTDGNYRATLLAAGITDAVGNELDGDGNGIGGDDHVFDLFRFFGDINGDRYVGFADLSGFRSTYQKDSTQPEYDARFDVNADNYVGFADLSAFRQNYQKAIEVPFDIIASSDALAVPEGDTAGFTVALSAQPQGTVTVTTARTSGDEDLSVTSGGTLTFNSTNWDVPQTVTINAAEDEDEIDGAAEFTISADGAANQPVVSATEIDNDNVPAFWAEQVKLTADDAASGDYYGQSVSIDGNKMIVGAPVNGSGSAHIYTYDGTDWQEQILIPSDGSTNDRFGISVAISGDWAIVGAYVAKAKAAYMFEYDGSEWQQRQILTEASDNGYYGHSVSISGDTAIVGAYGSDCAYIYTYNGSSWQNQQTVTAFGSEPIGEFGLTVVIEGDIALVGDNNSSGGAVYVYSYDGSSWQDQQRLTAWGGATGGFWRSMAIHEQTIVVGAPSEGAGAAFVFSYDGSAWQQQQKLTALDADSGDEFGYSVAIEGGTIVVGARYDDEAGSNAGAGYVFAYGDGSWEEQQKLLASDIDNNDQFGCSVSISDDLMVFGARFADDEGAAYVFGTD